MDRIELGQSLNLKQNFIPEENANRSGRQLRPSQIAVHNTDNTSRGADALAHSRHLINNAGDSGYGPTSWHYTVDDTRVIKHLPLNERGMHAFVSGNRVSIGIEMCMNSDGNWEKTVDRTARLLAILCYDFGWSSSVIKQHNHYPRANGTRKNCPSRIRSGYNGITWMNFVDLAEDYLNTIIGSDDNDHGEIVIADDLLSPEG